MRRVLEVILAGLVQAQSLAAFGQPPDEGQSGATSGPAEQLTAIVKAQEGARERYHKELVAAKGEGGRQEAIDRFLPEVAKNANAALELARMHPRDPCALQALGFVVRTARAGPGNETDQALEMLARDHARDPGIGEICIQSCFLFQSPLAEALIRSVLEQNPNRQDRGRACHALAWSLRYQARIIRRLEKEPELRKVYEQGRNAEEVVRRLRKDPDALDREADALLERVISEYRDVDAAFGTRKLAEIATGELFAARNLATGNVAPEIECRDHEGKAFRLGDYRGKVVVLTFSGNWCGPCVAMYPQERALVERMKGRPFALVSVSTDTDDGTLRKSIGSGEITWRCWWDGGPEGPITTRWGVTSFPAIFVLDRDGVIRFKDVRGEELDKAVDSLIAETSPTDRAP
jgi:peroxiredoxin